LDDFHDGARITIGWALYAVTNSLSCYEFLSRAAMPDRDNRATFCLPWLFGRFQIPHPTEARQLLPDRHCEEWKRRGNPYGAYRRAEATQTSVWIASLAMTTSGELSGVGALIGLRMDCRGPAGLAMTVRQTTARF
jgi:hypothetical protein